MIQPPAKQENGPSENAAGPAEYWPLPLRLTVSIMQNTPLPMLLMWGRQQLMLYNASYARLAGLPEERVPGGTVPVVLPAAWSWNPAVLELAWAGEAQTCARQPLQMWRGQDARQELFDLHYTPVREQDGAVAGILCTVAPPGAAQPQQAAQSLSVLVVEDNLDAQYLVCEMLRTFGHQVDAAPSGEEALRLLAGGTYHVLLSDVSLPGISGVDLARAALRDKPTLRVVFASGYSSSLTEHLDFPAMSIQKPYDIEQLQGILSDIAAEVQ
jgi:CheY-like chemotaxis protein